MRLLFLTLSLSCSTFLLHAQKTVLYEAFSNENCADCAIDNPTLDALVSGNANKVLLVRYMVANPSPGALSIQNTQDASVRQAYYNVPTTLPYGRLDGQQQGNGNITNLNQTNLNAAAANPTPFTISVVHNWTASGDSLTAQVSITANSAFSPFGAQMKLRAALVEDVEFLDKPGNNGERTFKNIMRKMYPNANGTAIPNSWTANMTQAVNLAGPVQRHVNKAANTYLIVWIQNDNDKKIEQAAKSSVKKLANDAGTENGATANPLICAGNNAQVTGYVTLRNAGILPLTSATIYYHYDGGIIRTYAWTGLISPGGTTSVPLPGAVLGQGKHVLYDSVAMPNGVVDANHGNDGATVFVQIQNSLAIPLPIFTDFENGGLPANYIFYNPNNNDESWTSYGGQVFSGVNAVVHKNFEFQIGESNYLILPTPVIDNGAKSFDFWLAYARQTTEMDRLDVVYSTNCGLNWTSVWSQKGADLETRSALGAGVPYVPAIGDWRMRSIDVTNVPSGALVALKATSDGGNYLYVDDITLRKGGVTAVRNLSAPLLNLELFPIPARKVLNLKISTTIASMASISISDFSGRDIYQETHQLLPGAQAIVIDLPPTAAGIYMLRLNNGQEVLQRRLMIVGDN